MKKMILAVVAAVAVAGSAGAQSGVRYPYVTSENGGVVVVLRDSKGGIDESSLFSSRVTASKTGNEASADNRMSRKFRVQKSNPGQKTCPMPCRIVTTLRRRVIRIGVCLLSGS